MSLLKKYLAQKQNKGIIFIVVIVIIGAIFLIFGAVALFTGIKRTQRTAGGSPPQSVTPGNAADEQLVGLVVAATGSTSPANVAGSTGGSVAPLANDVAASVSNLPQSVVNT